MFGTAENLAILATSVALAVGALWLLRGVRPPRAGRGPEDAVGWHISLIGTTYAVITAFMLSQVWTNFRAAETTAATEAAALVNLFRLAEGLPAPQRQQIQALSREYADVAVTREWPAMSHDSANPPGFNVTQQLWTTLMRTEAHSTLEQISLTAALGTLGRMTEQRRIRQLESRERLPTILWVVLIAGGVATVGASCTFEARSLRLHTFQVVTLSSLIALVLVAIADINRPFQGAVRVPPDGFEFARVTFDQLASAPPESVFRCPDGAELRARYVADTVVLRLPAGGARLPLAPSGSGARYANDTLEFWEHAGAVQVAQRGRVRYEDCRGAEGADRGRAATPGGR